MSDLSTTSYFHLLSALLQAIGQDEAVNTIDREEGMVEWTVDNLIVRLFPHALGEKEIEEPNAIVIEADLMLLDLENRKINHDRFLTLHQLNAVSRLTTGIVAFITEEGMLCINKILMLEALTHEELANQIATVIDSAEKLYEGWNALGRTANDFIEEEEISMDKPKNVNEKFGPADFSAGFLASHASILGISKRCSS
jgi:hypothetical protein